MERNVYALICSTLASIRAANARPAKCSYTDGDIVRTHFWAVLHDRPTTWACRRDSWPWHDRKRPLPDDSTMSRRLHTESVQRLILRVLPLLQPAPPATPDLLVLDGKPVPVSGHSQDKGAGCGRGVRGFARGYKLHAIIDLGGNVRAFRVAPLNISEQAAAEVLLGDLGPQPLGTRLLADANYDSNALYALAGLNGVQLLAARRRADAQGIGHRRHSPHRLAALQTMSDDPDVLRPRRRIEGFFGTVGNVVGGLAPLPNFVRGLHRVTRWVTAKLVINAAHARLRSTRAVA